MAILTGVRSGSLPSFSSDMGLLLSSAIGPEHEVLMDDDAQRPAGADGDGRLDVEVPLGDALAGAVGVLLCGFPQRPDQIALLAAEAQLGRSEEHTSELQSLM